MKRMVWSALFFLIWPALSLAGVAMTDANGGKTYISEGKLKHVDAEGNISIFTVARQEMVLADPGRKVYSRGTVKDFCQAGQQIMDQAMSQMSPEEREIMKQFMVTREESRTPPRVTVAPAGSGGRVAGFDTLKYSVAVNDQPYHEVWIAEDKTLREEMKSFPDLLSMTAEIADCMGQGFGTNPPIQPENTAEYQALYQKGFPLKTVSLVDGTTEVTDEIRAVEIKSLDDALFQPPKEYSEVAYGEFMQGE